MNNIGFGCAHLTSNFTEKQAIRNLCVAYDNGITHFDVARLYGFGLAEGILGKFACNKRSSITITTKVGLFPNNVFLKNLFFQNGVRYVYRLIKKSRAGKTIKYRADQTVIKNFNIREIRLSLETSLKELRTDYIDYLLLHEAEIAEANNEELIDFLETQKNKGLIKAYGIGSYKKKIITDFHLLSTQYSVLQTDNSFPESIPEVLMNASHIRKRFYFSPMFHLIDVKHLLETEFEISHRISGLLDYDIRSSCLDLFLIQQFQKINQFFIICFCNFSLM